MRILIFKPKNYPQPIGGPAGYLYNLKMGIKSDSDIDICFLPDIRISRSDSSKEAFISAVKNISITKPLIIARRVIKRYQYVNDILRNKNNYDVDLNTYDCIHFHTTIDMYKTRDLLSDYRGLVILTSHSPIPLHDEIYQESGRIEKIILKKRIKQLEIIDDYSFKKADYIIQPCVNSDDGYIRLWPKYGIIKRKKVDNYRYCLTGVVNKNVSESRECVRDKYKIPQDAIVLSYIGRHSSIKGYDVLVKLAKRILAEYNNVFFIIGGHEGTIKGLNHKRWMEIGWTNNPQDLINASDVFLLPNKETYFDLVLLEALSLGTPIITSNIGGNKIFANDKGVILYNSESELIEKVNEIIKMSPNERKILSDENKKLYNSKFTENAFGDRYLELIKNLLV